MLKLEKWNHRKRRSSTFNSSFIIKQTFSLRQFPFVLLPLACDRNINKNKYLIFATLEISTVLRLNGTEASNFQVKFHFMVTFSNIAILTITAQKNEEIHNGRLQFLLSGSCYFPLHIIRVTYLRISKTKEQIPFRLYQKWVRETQDHETPRFETQDPRPRTQDPEIDNPGSRT